MKKVTCLCWKQNRKYFVTKKVTNITGLEIYLGNFLGHDFKGKSPRFLRYRKQIEILGKILSVTPRKNVCACASTRKNGGKFKSILQSKNSLFYCQRLFKQTKKHCVWAVWTRIKYFIIFRI